MGDVLLVLVPLAMSIWAVIDAIQTEDTRVLFLPKIIWILLILLFPTCSAKETRRARRAYSALPEPTA